MEKHLVTKILFNYCLILNNVWYLVIH